MNDALLITIFLAILGNMGLTGFVWRKLGKVEKAVDIACPFGKCPFYERAKKEAAKVRFPGEGEHE